MQEPAFTLIGDLVGSRRVASRKVLHERLLQVLEEVNQLLTPRLPFEPTVGDEVEACFEDAATAIRASLTLRLALLRTMGIDSRYGLGAGEVGFVTAGEGASSQDGPGWWAARHAIDRSRETAEAPRLAFVRTTFFVEEEIRDSIADMAMVNAFLLCRDAMIYRMSQANKNRLYGLLRGWSQTQIAAEEDTTQSAVSQGLARSGAFSVLAAQEELEQDS